MFIDRFNYVVERAAIVAICLWGSWAIYYWLMVLVFDASFTDLKLFSPLLVLLLVGALALLLPLDLGLNYVTPRRCAPAARAPAFAPGGMNYGGVAVLTGLAVATVLVVEQLQWSKSPLSYNLLWAFMLPAFLFYLIHSRVAPAADTNLTANSSSDSTTDSTTSALRWVDCAVFSLSTVVLAVVVYGTGFPTPDDAFYAHVMSSTLANPELPVQGQDLLLATEAPYSLHPSYRPAGVEVLVTLLADVLGLDALQSYYKLLPVQGALLWMIFGYTFLRVLRVPLPGLAVAVCMLVLLFMTNPNYPTPTLTFLYWGKTLVRAVGPALLFFAVAAFVLKPGIRSWALLLFSVCSVTVWSSTALFIAPVCIGLAAYVFLPSLWGSPRMLLAILLALAPVFLVALYSLIVLTGAPVEAEGNSGMVRVDGAAYGGIYLKVGFLLILLILPYLSRTIADQQFQRTILRLCIAGFFTTMAPYIVEALAAAGGMKFISFRLPSAFPFQLLIGILFSVTVMQSTANGVGDNPLESRVRFTALGAALFAVLFAATPIDYVYGASGKELQRLYGVRYNEAIEVRKLIPAGATVAAGYLDEILPILPDPPTFLFVRHYLNYHKQYLSDREYQQRKFLHHALRDRVAVKPDNLPATIERIALAAETVGATTIVFRVITGFGEAYPDLKKDRFVDQLTRALSDAGYACLNTPSGRARVCNR